MLYNQIVYCQILGYTQHLTASCIWDCSRYTLYRNTLLLWAGGARKEVPSAHT